MIVVFNDGVASAQRGQWANRIKLLSRKSQLLLMCLELLKHALSQPLFQALNGGLLLGNVLSGCLQQ